MRKSSLRSAGFDKSFAKKAKETNLRKRESGHGSGFNFRRSQFSSVRSLVGNWPFSSPTFSLSNCNIAVSQSKMKCDPAIPGAAHHNHFPFSFVPGAFSLGHFISTLILNNRLLHPQSKNDPASRVPLQSLSANDSQPSRELRVEPKRSPNDGERSRSLPHPRKALQ